MNGARATVAEATSTSEGENRGRNQHWGNFGTLGASSTYRGDSKQRPGEILTQGPCSGQHVAARLQCGLATRLPGRDVSSTLFNHFLLSIFRRAKALLADTCHRPCTEAPWAHPETRDTGAKKRLHSTAQPSQQQICWKPHTYCSHSFPTRCPARAGGEYCLLKCTVI